MHLEGRSSASEERITGCDRGRDVAQGLQPSQFGFPVSHLSNEDALPHLNDCLAETSELRGSDYGLAVDLAVREIAERR